MKSPCGQPASLHSTPTLSIQLAMLVSNLQQELPKPAPTHGDRQQVHCQPPQQHRLKSSSSSSSCPAQQTAESRVAGYDTPGTGFALRCGHGFAPGAAACTCWEGRPLAGPGSPRATATLGCVAQMLGEGGGICSTCSYCVASFRIMLLMSSSHRLAEENPSTLVLASPEVIPEFSQSKSINQKEKVHPFPYEMLYFWYYHANVAESTEKNANALPF